MEEKRPNQGFGADVLKLLSGTTLGQLVAFAATPIIVRIFSPAAFGELAIFAAISGIFTVVACLRYELAIMLPESEEEAAGLVGASVIFACLVGTISLPVVLLLKPLMSSLLPADTNVLYLVPLAVTSAGVGLALNYWNSRKRRYACLSLTRVLNLSSCAGMQVAGGIAGFTTSLGLIVPRVIAQCIATGVLIVRTLYSDWRPLWRGMSVRNIVNGVVRHRKFFYLNTAAGLLNYASWQLPILLLALFFSKEVAGFYALGDMVLRVPLNLLGSSLSQVFYQRASIVARDPQQLARIVESVYGRLVATSLVPLLLVTLTGPQLFEFCFGHEWITAGVYAQILAVWVFFWFTASPMGQIFSVMERQETTLRFNALIFFTRILALGVGSYFFHSVPIALGLFAVSGIVAYGAFGWKILIEAGVTRAAIRHHVASNLLVALPAVAAIWIVQLLSDSSSVLLAAAAIILAVHLVTLVRRDNYLRGLVRRFQPRRWATR